MKKIVLFLCIVLMPLLSNACNLSSISLQSVTPGPGGTFVITVQACFGYGLTGVTAGANDVTRDFAFAIYTPGAVPMNITSFTPASVVGSVTGNAYIGFDAGPQGPPFASQGTIGYFDPTPGYPNGLGCVSSTPACGNVGTQCDTYVFTVDVMPDSIRVFGLEGAGNPFGGCTADPDMLIDFATVLNVEWGDISVTNLDERKVEINWSTQTETNNEKFIVQKLEPVQHVWWDLTTVEGAGTTLTPNEYSYTDEYVSNGINYYRIKQIDYDGNYSLSNTFSVDKFYEGYVPTNVFPNPANTEVFIEGYKGSFATIISSDGKRLESFNIDSNHHEFSTVNLEDGIYIVQIVKEEEIEIVKLVIDK